MTNGTLHITNEHLRGFGAILNAFAALEGQLDELILCLIGAKPTENKDAAANASILLSKLQLRDKTDYCRALDGYTKLPGAAWTGKGLIKILDRIKSKTALRNNAAHSLWNKGRRPGSIKPLFIGASGNLKLLGASQNEKDWTADELIHEANEILGIMRDLDKWMSVHNLHLLIEE